jgi:acetyl esterase
MKHIKHILALILAITLLSSFCFAQKAIEYKQVDTTKLNMTVYYPPQMDDSTSYPAMVFFFGGGWTGGRISQFEPHARYFSQRGIVCFLVDYRTNKKHKTTPFECVKDAKSAMRFVRSHAADFQVDADKIIASGGSAGGHLAATTALISKYNESSDDLKVSCIPNALVLFNPVFDNGPGGYGYSRIGDEYKDFSPLHNIKKGAPPTIVFLGTKDKHIPVTTAEYYKVVMEKVGSQCELRIYEEQEHGFFNKKNPEMYKQTIFEADEFLQSLGYLTEKKK